jgi:hypothetical protein
MARTSVRNNIVCATEPVPNKAETIVQGESCQLSCQSKVESLELFVVERCKVALAEPAHGRGIVVDTCDAISRLDFPIRKSHLDPYDTCEELHDVLG